MRISIKLLFCTVVFFALGGTLIAKDDAKDLKVKKCRIRSVWGSWGYNEEWYTNSNVHIQQSALGNNYEIVQAQARDHLGWNTGILNKALTIPQYNYRLGFYLNEQQDMGFELNFDHTKYLLRDPQTIHVTGTMNNQSVNEYVNFTQSNGFYYYLNNGANFFLFNFVKRWGITRSQSNNFALDFVGKAGIGPVVPHVQNMLFGEANLPHFQLGGWNTGVETVLRATIYKYAFVEFSQKVDYARYQQLSIYEGKAHQAFGTYEIILSVGAYLPTVKNNSFFSHHKSADTPVKS